MGISEGELRTLEGFRAILARLRGPDGCPWDRVQTHASLKPYLLEEAYEALAALDEGDPRKLCDELGDLLLEVFLHIQLAEEAQEFTLADVIYGIASKIVRRHPHIFGEEKADSPEEVMVRWQALKREERGPEGSALAGVPQAMPALARAQMLLARAATPEQLAQVGDQTGGRVFLFLHTSDFWNDYKFMQSRGVRFTEEPRQEPYGQVVVFFDLYGNKWDLVQPIDV